MGAMGGLYEFVVTNYKAAGGTLTKANLDLYMKDLLQHGTQNVVLFASPVVGMALSGFLRDAWQPTTTDARLWGAKVDGFISGAYGFRVPVVIKRDWNDFSTANSQYGGWAFLVDMDNVQLRKLRDTSLLRDRQANDSDSYDEEYLSELVGHDPDRAVARHHHGRHRLSNPRRRGLGGTPREGLVLFPGPRTFFQSSTPGGSPCAVSHRTPATRSTSSTPRSRS